MDCHQANCVKTPGPIRHLPQVLLLPEKLEPSNGAKRIAHTVPVRSRKFRPEILQKAQELKNRQALLLRVDRIISEQVAHVAPSLEQVPRHKLPGVTPKRDSGQVRPE